MILCEIRQGWFEPGGASDDAREGVLEKGLLGHFISEHLKHIFISKRVIILIEKKGKL